MLQLELRTVVLQLPPNPVRLHFVRTTGRVHEYPDGSIAVFLGPHRLADYDPSGTMTLPELRTAAA